MPRTPILWEPLLPEPNIMEASFFKNLIVIGRLGLALNELKVAYSVNNPALNKKNAEYI